MDQFSKGELPRAKFLKEMGAISLKADRAASRMVQDDEVLDKLIGQVMDDSDDSHDSLSETRPLPMESAESETEEEDYGELPYKKPPTKAAAKKTKADMKKQLCPVCKRGFQLRRDPPLHSVCCECGKFTHKRCIKNLEDVFVCCKCSRPANEVASAGPALSANGASMAATTSNTPEVLLTPPSPTFSTAPGMSFSVAFLESNLSVEFQAVRNCYFLRRGMLWLTFFLLTQITREFLMIGWLNLGLEGVLLR